MVPLSALLLQASPTPPFPGAGELFALSAATCWGVATVLFTLAFRQNRAQDAVLIKNLGGAIALGLLAWILGSDHEGGAPPANNLGWLLFSGVLGLGIGDWLYFVALAHIGVGRTMILTQTIPVATALTAWFTHGEVLSGTQWLGAIFIVSGGWLAESRRERRGQADKIGILAALGSVIAFTLGNVTMSEGVSEAGVISGAAWRLAGGAIGIFAICALRGDAGTAFRATTSGKSWRAFLFPSILGTWLGMSFLAGGFKWAKQGVASALAGATPLISIPLAVLFLGEKPGIRGWAGACLVVIGVAVLGLAA